MSLSSKLHGTYTTLAGVSRQKYPGELHAITKNVLGKYVLANWLGPGTNVQERLEDGSSMPVNDLDGYAKTHDIAYTKAGAEYDKTRDKKAFEREVHAADRTFISRARTSHDDPVTGRLASELIQKKMNGEQLGILPTKVFSGRARRKTKTPVRPFVTMAMKPNKKK